MVPASFFSKILQKVIFKVTNINPYIYGTLISIKCSVLAPYLKLGYFFAENLTQM